LEDASPTIWAYWNYTRTNEERTMKIYLASPFFTPAQVAVVEGIEKLISKYPSLEVYSPRKDGVLIEMPPEEKKKNTRRIFAKNVAEIFNSDVVIAVVDGRDQGTTWEIGFAYAMVHLLNEMRIVTYTDADYGLNVMIKECVDAHVHGLAELEALLRGVMADEVGIYKKFRDFDPRVT
jgi:nucleoside 2-deoxyribosyltransferase